LFILIVDKGKYHIKKSFMINEAMEQILFL
jgi:hypothetical protein